DDLLRLPFLEQLAGDLGGQRAACDALPDHEAAAGFLAALPARAAVGLRVLLDDLAGLGAAARAQAELDALGAELLLVERGDLLDSGTGELFDVLDELAAVFVAVLDVGEALLPVAGQLRRGERVLLEHRDHLEALRRRGEILARALDVLAADQGLDRLGARGRGAEPALLHGLAQLLVVDQLAGGLHRREQRGLGVARRRLGLLRLDLGDDALHGLALFERRQRR